MKTNTPKVVTFARQNLPIICPVCSGSLGIIDEHDLASRHAWAVALSPLEIDAPNDDPSITVDANLLHGECPACGAELAAISIAFRRQHEASAEGADEPQSPSLSLALHGKSYSGWAMIETRGRGVECVEHLFEPGRAARAEKSIEFLREFLFDDLPRPQVPEIEAEAES